MNNKMLRIFNTGFIGSSAPTQNQESFATNGWDLHWAQDNIGQFKYSITAIVSDNKK